ncbi:methionyl aminopeptidase [Enteropsectra breve]|nr:methionyl aminopeptidase [Enteropsectra breve]
MNDQKRRSFTVLNEQLSNKPIEFLNKEDYETTGDAVLNNALRAAEAHRRVRYSLHELLQPGASLREVVQRVEQNTRILLKGEKNNGIGFPCGISLNECAAHFTLNPENPDIFLKESDVLKIDFGTHSDGFIMDSAFTVCFDEKYKQLLLATKEATARGLEVIGVDMAVSEIGREINEVFRSFEMEIDGRFVPIRQVYNLNGHSIERYKIHGGISIPQLNNGDSSRISEGFCAIETFATTGQGEVLERGESSHFMLNAHPVNKIYGAQTARVLETIKREFGTLPFSPSHLDFYEKNSHTSLKLLSLRKFVDPYPPLYDVAGSHVAQFEHTVYLKDGSKQIMTLGDDY